MAKVKFCAYKRGSNDNELQIYTKKVIAYICNLYYSLIMNIGIIREKRIIVYDDIIYSE